jgi:hypothetical protein
MTGHQPDTESLAFVEIGMMVERPHRHFWGGETERRVRFSHVLFEGILKRNMRSE